MKIGVLSLAHMHAFSYLDCIRKTEGLELIGIAEENANSGRKAADKYRTKYFDNYHDLLARDCDAVIITSENSNHPEMAIASAEAGKHILCEKPIAATREGALSIIKALEKNAIKFQMAFPCRFSTPIKHAKEKIERGDLGAIKAIVGTNHGKMPGGWFVKKELSGGGAIIDHTVHVLDLMRWMMNSEVTKIYAERDTHFHDIEVDDCGLMFMEFENGAFATLDPSWSRPKSYPTWGDVTMEIVGEKGTLFVDAFKQSVEIFDDSKVAHYSSFWGDNMDLSMIHSFVQCVRKDKFPTVSALDGLRALEVAVAAYISAERGSVVKMNEPWNDM